MPYWLGGALITALGARSWADQSVLLVCAGLVVAAVVPNLCVPDVYRVNRLEQQQAG